MNKHFELTDETIHYDGRTLHRIRATRELPYHAVKPGDLGGFVEHLDNLSDSAWVADEAMVYDDARVSGNALVYDDARVYGNARVAGNARVSGNAQVFGDALVSDDAFIYDKAQVAGKAHIFENAEVTDNAQVSDDAQVYNWARVCGNARVFGYARVFGNAHVFDNAHVFGYARVSEEKHIMIGTLCTNRQFNWTLHRTTDGHFLNIGCMSGTLDDHQILCDSDSWIETTDPEIIRDARPEYQHIIDLCRARVARWNN